MKEITLTEEQAAALQSIMTWYHSGSQNVYTLAGYAGTGKSTLAALLMTRIKGLRYVTYTGKAASVLRSKLPEEAQVSTIHQLIYIPEKDDYGKLRFKKRYEIDDVSLIVVDEASMVGEKIFEDLLSYGIPILFIGDNAQLPPVKDVASIHMNNPDFILEEIHRQALENPIIRFSMDIRTGNPIKWVTRDDKIKLLYKNQDGSKLEDLKKNYNIDRDIFLCGFNKTRIALNQQIRRYLGFNNPEPQVNDKVICLLNNHTERIYNGMLGVIQNIETEEFEVQGGPQGTEIKELYKVDIKFDNMEYSGYILPDQFNTIKNKDDVRKRIGYDTKIYPDLFDFGYGISVHKSQGSEFDNVVVLRESCKFWEQKRWDYTAVTRAINTLTFVM